MHHILKYLFGGGKLIFNLFKNKITASPCKFQLVKSFLGILLNLFTYFSLTCCNLG